MAIDPARVRRTGSVATGQLPASDLHKVYCTPEEIETVTAGCKTAGHRPPDRSRSAIKHVIADLAPAASAAPSWRRRGLRPRGPGGRHGTRFRTHRPGRR